jgi:hypothetical protein
MRKTARPVVWEGDRAQSRSLDLIDEIAGASDGFSWLLVDRRSTCSTASSFALGGLVKNTGDKIAGATGFTLSAASSCIPVAQPPACLRVDCR